MKSTIPSRILRAAVKAGTFLSYRGPPEPAFECPLGIESLGSPGKEGGSPIGTWSSQQHRSVPEALVANLISGQVGRILGQVDDPNTLASFVRIYTLPSARPRQLQLEHRFSLEPKNAGTVSRLGSQTRSIGLSLDPSLRQLGGRGIVDLTSARRVQRQSFPSGDFHQQQPLLSPSMIIGRSVAPSMEQPRRRNAPRRWPLQILYASVRLPLPLQPRLGDPAHEPFPRHTRLGLQGTQALLGLL